MSSVEYRFLEPLDRLFLRGNRLFGEAGSYGESLIPPWPSVAAGAIRSRILVDAGIDLNAFAAGQVNHPQLGTPQRPGSFQITAFQLARRTANGTVEPIYPLPADLVVSHPREGTALTVQPLRPTPVAAGIVSSSPLSQLPLLAESERSKAATGYGLLAAGWRRYLNGEVPLAADLIPLAALWKLESQVGIGLDPTTGSVQEGQLFTVQAVAMGRDFGFWVAVRGATLPSGGLLRLGGDGRAVAIHPTPHTEPPLDSAALLRARRCRLILTTPALFAEGWRLPGQQADGRFNCAGVQGRVVAAAVPRSEVISGWDLAQQQPKPAERAAPAGSVYWIEELQGSAEALAALQQQGLWADHSATHSRQAEGFNRIQLAFWSA